ncbi:MAG: hypothetical protein M3141_01380 [Actinomycetota bacterium]|nr:hypothetical protein [Actinomycetota bacterium]
MATVDRHAAAESHVRRLLEAGGVPPPDEVEHRETDIVLLWHESKVAVVIELDELLG